MRKNNYEWKINEEKEKEKIKDLTEKNENDRINFEKIIETLKKRKKWK